MGEVFARELNISVVLMNVALTTTYVRTDVQFQVVCMCVLQRGVYS